MFFLIWYRETSDIGWLAVPSGLATASLLELECSIVGSSYFQCYLALLQNMQIHCLNCYVLKLLL